MSYDVEWANAEFHEVLPRLFLGGHDWTENGRKRDSRVSTVSTGDWDYVVSAYMEPRHEQSFPQCDTRFIFFKDTEKGLEEETWSRIMSAVDSIVARWSSGSKVLVRCQAGYNRSGLIMGLVLMRLGLNAENAIKLMRQRRSPDVLINKVFENDVREREVLYRRLDMLEYVEKVVGPGWISFYIPEEVA